MKKIETSLNEEQYKRFIERAKKYRESPYALLKELVLIELERPPRQWGFKEK